MCFRPNVAYFLTHSERNETTRIPTMAPIRWAASAPLLPPLRHLTRSIFQSNNECQWRQTVAQNPPLVCWQSKTPDQLYSRGSTWLRHHWLLSCWPATWLEENFWNSIHLRQQILINGVVALKGFQVKQVRNSSFKNAWRGKKCGFQNMCIVISAQNGNTSKVILFKIKLYSLKVLVKVPTFRYPLL